MDRGPDAATWQPVPRLRTLELLDAAGSVSGWGAVRVLLFVFCWLVFFFRLVFQFNVILTLAFEHRLASYLLQIAIKL
jgi:hypothetical protein